MLQKSTRDAITAQVLSEITFARDSKRNILSKWHRGEDFYYSNAAQWDFLSSIYD